MGRSPRWPLFLAARFARALTGEVHRFQGATLAASRARPRKRHRFLGATLAASRAHGLASATDSEARHSQPRARTASQAPQIPRRDTRSLARARPRKRHRFRGATLAASRAHGLASEAYRFRGATLAASRAHGLASATDSEARHSQPRARTASQARPMRAAEHHGEATSHLCDLAGS